MPETNTTSTKTVYFLGAGASAASDFKLPVMKGFFKEEDFLDKEEGEYPNLKRFLTNLYHKRPKREINLEEVITHLELTMEGFNWRPFESFFYDVRSYAVGCGKQQNGLFK